MPTLSEHMLNLAKVNKGILLTEYRGASITAYNRLEPRARSENFERSLRAEVRDPLWMLTRQWQMGELQAEDCGSPIDARITTKELHIDTIALSGTNGKKYDKNIPMEAFVEKEKVPFTHCLRIQAGLYFLKLHTDALREKYIAKYRSNFRINVIEEKKFVSHTDSLNLYNATKELGIDGEKILKAVSAGTLTTEAAIEAGDIGKIQEYGDQLKSWYQRQYYQPAGPGDSAWQHSQLNYHFKVSAAASEQSQVVLDASEYHGGRLDWYSFDNVLRPQPLSSDNQDDDEENENKPEEQTISFIPVTPSFKGIPNARFWEMEDRQVDFGKMNAKTTDHLLLVFTEFGLIYANDWFMIPYRMKVNTLCEIKGIVVTDVFGERTFIRAADEGQDSNWQRWSMFNLSNKDLIGQYNKQFFLPASLTQTIESDAIEKVHFIRDEMVNMCWGIEGVVPDQTSQGADGHMAADKTGVLIPPVQEDLVAKIRYLLGNTVPENWIPFIPVHKPGSVQDIRFQRAAMPQLNTTLTQVVNPKGVLLTEKDPPYYINEEEIPYSGTIVSRSFQRTRWLDGKTFVWMGRYRETGRGQGSSNLMFDQILPITEIKVS